MIYADSIQLADKDSTVSIDALLAAGYGGFCGYLRPNLSKGWVDELEGRGGIFLPIVEFDGKPGGLDDGRRLGAAAVAGLERIGRSDYGCSFADNDAVRVPYSLVADTFWGIGEQFAGPKVSYGPTDQNDQLVRDGLAQGGWTEGAWSFSPGYNGSRPSPPQGDHDIGCQFPRQTLVAGAAVDYNEFDRTKLLWLPNHGGMMTAEYDALTAQIKALADQMNRNDLDTRAYEGQTPLKLPESEKQYLVVWNGQTWAKRWLRDQSEVAALVKQNILQRAAGSATTEGLQPFFTLEGAEADWLRALPEV